MLSVFVCRRGLRFLLLPLAAACATGQRPTTDESVVAYLNQTIAWYRDVASLDRSGSQREALFADNLRESSMDALRAAFQFARADAAFPAKDAPLDDGRSRNLINAQASADQRIEQTQARLDEVVREMEKAPPRARPQLEAMRAKLEGDLRLAKARRDSVRNVLGVLNSSDTGLLGQVGDLEHTVPELANPKSGNAAARVAAPDDFRADSAGIVALTARLFSVSQKDSSLKRAFGSTSQLLKLNGNLRTPLRNSLRAGIQRSDALAQLPDTTAAPELTDARKELDALLSRFKLLSAALAPLGQASSALEAGRANLIQWRSALNEEYRTTLRYLLLRLGMLAVAVLVIMFLSEVWRRATIRYVQDVRRRRQILLLRRIVVGCTIAVFVLLSFVTEFGSIATFAGFSAAGIAVAMQSVILSVVAYFFLVGRWGVRVGDRITVSGVTGDVIDIGLFRLYLMEVAGSGLDLHPTGRIVVFPNAVFFQPSAMFKQFPGIDYTWCTLSLSLASGADYQAAEKRLMGAVESVYADYREEIERQHRAAQLTRDLHTPTPRPAGSLRFTNAQVEFVVRCPVQIGRMAEVADRLTRALVAAMEQEPQMQFAIASPPKLQTAVSGPAAG